MVDLREELRAEHTVKCLMGRSLESDEVSGPPPGACSRNE